MVDLEDCAIMLKNAIREFNESGINLRDLPTEVRDEFFAISKRIDAAFKNNDAMTTQHQIMLMRRMLIG